MIDLSFILTTRNTLPYTKLAYESIRRYNPDVEIVMLDDCSTDGTLEWMDSLVDEFLIKWKNPTNKQLGHTITYNKGAEIATRNNICIFHSDMVCSKNFVTNLLKHLKPKTIVSGTRIEPPVYPSDNAKITKDFGIYFENFKEKEFTDFVDNQEKENLNVITKGFFAPWIMNKEEYLAIGGMDKLFAPYPVEDSDFISRLLLNNYSIIQSRDSICYHWASRAHRWTTGKVQVDTTEFKYLQNKAIRNFIRKWQQFIKNDEFSHPKLSDVYNVGFIVKNCKYNMLYTLEPWCRSIYIEDSNLIKNYIETEQKETLFNMTSRVKHINEFKNNDITVEFDANLLSANNIEFITQLSDVISSSGETGKMEYDIFTFDIQKIVKYNTELKLIESQYYQKQLI